MYQIEGGRRGRGRNVSRGAAETSIVTSLQGELDAHSAPAQSSSHPRGARERERDLIAICQVLDSHSGKILQCA